MVVVNSLVTVMMYQNVLAVNSLAVVVLAAGDIRLVRSAWLLAQPAGYRIVKRQELEALEASGASPSPHLRPDEAVALVREGRAHARHDGARAKVGSGGGLRPLLHIPSVPAGIPHLNGFLKLFMACRENEHACRHNPFWDLTTILGLTPLPGMKRNLLLKNR